MDGTNARTLKVGEVQAAALGVYVLEEIHESHGMTLAGNTLSITCPIDEAWRQVIDGANSCDDDGDAEFRDALSRLASRIVRLPR